MSSTSDRNKLRMVLLGKENTLRYGSGDLKKRLLKDVDELARMQCVGLDISEFLSGNLPLRADDWRTACEQKMPAGQFFIAMMCIHAKNLTNIPTAMQIGESYAHAAAIPLLFASAAEEFAPALEQVGAYLVGKDDEESVSTGANNIRAAALAGYTPAQSTYATICEQTEQRKEWYKWMWIAARSGHKIQQVRLADQVLNEKPTTSEEAREIIEWIHVKHFSKA